MNTLRILRPKHKYGCSFRRNTIGLEKDEVIQLLKLVLENCVFTFQDKFFKQLHSAPMGSPCSPVVANIYMEYFENLALGPKLPIPVKDWKRYVDDVFSIIPKGKQKQNAPIPKLHRPTYKNSLLSNPTRKGGIPFLDTFPQTPRGRNCKSQYIGNPHTEIGTWTSIPVTYLSQKSSGKGSNGQGWECLFRSWYSS